HGLHHRGCDRLPERERNDPARERNDLRDPAQGDAAEARAVTSRVTVVLDWLRARTDTALGRLALQWFRAYFEASRNSGCAATVYSSLSVFPAALVGIALFYPTTRDSNAFAERLVS